MKKNAQVVAETLTQRGLRIVSGGTQSHVMLVDLRPKRATGKAAEQSLERALITTNKNGIPFDPEKPFVTSGIRIGTAAVTSRGFGLEEMDEIASIIALALKHHDNEEKLEEARRRVAALTEKFPLYA